MFSLNFKKFLNSFIMMLIVFSLITTTELSVCATDKVDFSLSGDSIDKDRLFNIDLIAKGNTNIAAVNVSLSYDSEYFEFRNISSPDKTFDVEYKTGNGKVTAIILCPYGYSFNGKAKLLSFKFKSIKSGSSNFNLSISDPVDSTPSKLSIGSVYGTNIIINGDKITSKSTNNKSSDNISSNGNVKSNSSKSVDVPQVQYADNDDSSYTTTNSVEDEDDIIINDGNSYTAYVIGGLVVLLMVAIFGIAYKLGKNNNQENDNTNK